MTAAKARAAPREGRASKMEDVTYLAPFVLSHRVSAENATPTEIVETAVQRALERWSTPVSSVSDPPEVVGRGARIRRYCDMNR